MDKLKVMTVVGTRPEIIRLSRVIVELDKNCDHILVHTGQNYDYELNEVFFENLEIRKPDFFLESAGSSSSETIGNVIIESEKLLKKVKPDAFLILGDTNSCMSILAAKRQKIPTFHMEAGNRCFDMRVPEEINRKIVDHIADINLTYSSIAREYLLREGIAPDFVIKTGSPMREVLEHFKEKILNCDVLKKLNLEENKFFLVSSHREENIDDEDNFMKFVNLLNSLDQKYHLPIVVSTHPRTRKQFENHKIKLSKNINLLKPMGFFEYNKLQISAKTVLSDSGTISEESSILNFKAVNIRDAHERPEAMEEASVMMVGYDLDRIMQALEILEDQLVGDQRNLKLVDDYEALNVSQKVVRIIHSYTNYVNHKVWHKK
tara:strand:- start:11928 stop:13058 length:1131 start_codon:yes stop_codon:yes gene_type:complete